MSAARRGAVAATVLLAGLVALLLSPAATRATTDPARTSPSPSVPTQSVGPVSSTSSSRTTPLLPPNSKPVCTTLTLTRTSSTGSSSEETTTASTLTYAVLPGNVTTIPPTATPKPSPTASPSPSETTDTGITALGTDTQSA